MQKIVVEFVFPKQQQQQKQQQKIENFLTGASAHVKRSSIPKKNGKPTEARNPSYDVSVRPYTLI